MRVEPSKKILDNQIAVVYHIAIHLYIEKGIALQGVRVIVLRRAVSRAREGNTLEADAIELLSLPLAINRVNVQQNRHSWPSVTSRSSEWGGNSIAPVFPQYAHLACLTSVQKDDAHPGIVECMN